MTQQTVTDEHKGLLAAGAEVVWRRRSILWWIFGVNIVLGALGTLPAARQLKHALSHSLAAEQLFKGFDLGMFYELVRVPDVKLLRSTTASYLFAGLFALFMLFISGGILETYRQGRRRISTGDFFAASGSFFWRFVRLALFSLVPLTLLGNAYLAVEKASDYLGDKALADQVGFAVWLAGIVVLVLLTLLVRLWFDLAKIDAVARDERRMLRSAWNGIDITRKQVGTLLWMYLRISLVAWITLLVAFLIWTKLPPTAVPITFVLLELVMLVQLGARLWQMASLTIWRKRHFEAATAASEDFPAQPQEVMEPEPQLPLYPDMELPPADAQKTDGAHRAPRLVKQLREFTLEIGFYSAEPNDFRSSGPSTNATASLP
jgi:hypothetical protein